MTSPVSPLPATRAVSGIGLAIAQFQPVEQRQALGRAGKGAPSVGIDALVQVE